MKAMLTILACVATIAVFAGTNTVSVATQKIAFSDFVPERVMRRQVPDGKARKATQAILTQEQIAALWAQMSPMMQLPECAATMHIEAFIFSPSSNGTVKVTATWVEN